MTIPWQMNCPHDDEGWCLPFVSEFGNEYMNLQMRNMDLNAENAKLREQLAEAVAALQTVTQEMETVIYSGFDPERWGERMEAISEAGKVLAAWNKPETC